MAAGVMVSALAAAVLAVAGAPPAQAARGGFQVHADQLIDAFGHPFVLRGTHLPHLWHPQRTSMSVHSSGLGANAARVALGSGHQWGASLDIAEVIDECKRVRMVCELSPQDATGYGEDPAAVSMLDVVNDYWAHPTVRDALQGEEAYVLVNVANAPWGDNGAAGWVDETVRAIRVMRDLGYSHTLVVDAPNWGQDWQFVMAENAPRVASADPLGNVVFSVHMREAFGTPAAVTGYLDGFRGLGLPLVVGDLAPGSAHAWVRAQAQRRGIGWTACCWSSQGSPPASTDQVENFDPDAITNWGKEVFLDTDGIQATAARATVFPGCLPGGDAPGPPGTPRASHVGPTTIDLDWGPACGDVAEYLVMHVVSGFEVLLARTSGSPPPNRVTVGGLIPDITYELGVRAITGAGQVGDLSETITVTTPPEPGQACLITYHAQLWGSYPGYTATVTVTNLGSTAIEGWTAQYEYPPGREVTPPGWGATVTQQGTTVTAVNASWNATIPVGATVQFGYSGQFTPPSFGGLPTDATLNGAPCAIEPGQPPSWP